MFEESASHTDHSGVGIFFILSPGFDTGADLVNEFNGNKPARVIERLRVSDAIT